MSTRGYRGEKRPARKCAKPKHLPGILSLSNDFFVCEYCDEVFDWIIHDEQITAIIELGDWPGSPRKIKEHKEKLSERSYDKTP